MGEAPLCIKELSPEVTFNARKSRTVRRVAFPREAKETTGTARRNRVYVS